VRLFVYGSLLAGESRHDLLAGATLLARTRTEPAFELADLGAYPALVAGGSTAVHGEVYAVDGALLADLDRYEGAPELYRRAVVRLEDGSEAQTYVLVGTAAAAPRIASGDWRGRKAGPFRPSA
jgi:gamma-glutamylcyclotransferase (GGCT)/AIG2-like uncharacterized protein YtfP